MKHLLISASLVSMAALAWATPALAHAGDHGAMPFAHLVSEPDHLAILLVAAGLTLYLVAKRLLGRRD